MKIWFEEKFYKHSVYDKLRGIDFTLSINEEDKEKWGLPDGVYNIVENLEKLTTTLSKINEKNPELYDKVGYGIYHLNNYMNKLLENKEFGKYNGTMKAMDIILNPHSDYIVNEKEIKDANKNK